MNRPILKKRDFKPVLANNKKEIFPLKGAFLDESERPVTRLSNQISSFRLETHKSLLTCVLLTFMLHYRIHGFLLTEWSVRKAFQSYVFHLRQQHWKHSILLIFERKIYPFFPPVTTPLTIPRMSVHQTLTMSFVNFRKTTKVFLGSFITIT